MKIFVTGATGFIGRNVVGALLQRGDDVVALVRREDESLPCPRVRGDLSDLTNPTNPTWVTSMMAGGFDAVLHAAALVDPIRDEDAADAINHRATVELARRAKDAGVRTMAFLSSVMAIGFHSASGLVSEDAPCRPPNAYGRSKRAAELGLLALDDADFNVCIVRPPTVYGRGDTKGNFLGLARAIDTGAFLVPGDGANRMTFCHVDNLTAALRTLIGSPEARGIYHVADDPPPTLREVSETVAHLLGRRLLPIPFPKPVATAVALACDAGSKVLRRSLPFGRVRLHTITRDFAFDCSRLRRTGYSQVMSFEEGVRDTLAFYRESGFLSRGRSTDQVGVR